MRRIALSLMVALFLSVSVVATTWAANPTVTFTVTARVVSISNTPSSWDFELVDTSSTYETGLTCFNTTNVGNVEVDISISGSNMTGGGYTWVISDTATPDDMVYGLKAGVDGEQDTVLYEYYNTGDDDYSDIFYIYPKAQTFTVTNAYLITSVKLKLLKVGAPTAIATVGIRATDGEGKPTGSNLCSGTIDCATLTTDSNGAWYEITLGDGYSLQAATKYAIVLDCPSATITKHPSWRMHTSGGYDDGQYLTSSDGGTTWTSFIDDFMFEGWGHEDSYNVTVKGAPPYNYLAENLTVDSSQQWGLKIWTPTDYDDGNDKTGSITITAAYSS